MNQSGTPVSEPDPLAFLAGGGEMGRLIRSIDWSGTPLGPVEAWPQSLRTTVSLCLASNFPIDIVWGPKHVQIYNDGYWPICGGKHPRSMGQNFSECWASAWPVIGEAFAQALAGQPSFLEDQRIFLDRNGYLEETFFTFSFSPIRDETGGGGGLFHPVTETTAKMLSERRTRALRDLSARTGKAKSVEEALALSAQTLTDYDLDLPFVLLYALNPSGQQARLIGSTGLKAGTAACPDSVGVGASMQSFWPVAEVFCSSSAVQVDDVARRLGPPPYGPYDEPPKAALVLPITPPGAEYPTVVLVAGVSPRLPMNEAYRSFYDLLASGVTTAVANARAYEEERRRAEARAELDRAKIAFFSNVSHEFRTPLTLMLGPVEELLDRSRKELSPAIAGQLEVVNRNGLRLLRLVNTLLDFSRIEAGRVRAVYLPTDLAAFTADLASVFRSACERAGLRLAVDCPTLDEPVFVDREMWEKVVLNLLSNAFKFTFEGEIAVTLRRAGSAAELVVRDTGTGVPAAEMPRLFERFHRVENARGRTHEGSGIGLALVQELVKLHGGSITAESVVGTGTTFTASVPLGSAHLPTDQIGEGRSLALTATGAMPYVEEALRWLPDDVQAGGDSRPELPTYRDVLPVLHLGVERKDDDRPRVLVADDNADMRQYVVRLLAGHYRTDAVPDGETALAAARDRPPDLILTDVMMPRLDGFGLLRALRAEPRTSGVPVIMLSARAGEESRVEGMEAGADDYLVKPFSARELLARVTAHLQTARLRREASESIRASEERFRALVSATSDVVYRMSADWTEMRHLRGREFIADTHEPSRSWLVKYIPRDDQPHVLEAIHAAIRSKGVFELEHRVVRVDGTVGWTFSRAIPLLDGDGEIVEWFGAASDVTARKQAEQERERLVGQLREQDRRKDEFLATLAHELRNPLAPIRNGLQVIRLAGANGTVEQARIMMDRQLTQLVRLVDDLLDVSRITRGKLELRTERADMKAVIDAAVETARPLIEQAGHELAVVVPDEPTFVDGDTTRLAQVVSNLLTNSAKYTHRGGHVRLSVGRDGETAVVAVKDDGIGIPPAMLCRVFEMFTQVDRTLEKTTGGLGIGLSLVKGLVEMHGGTIEARSEGEGRGSEFVVRLPVATSGAGEPDRTDGEAQGVEPFVRRRILVVDDNLDSADSLGHLLELLGNEVRTANDGAAGIVAPEAFRPDVVLMDIGMPKMNGYEACRHIRGKAWGRELVLVALTGWGQQEDRQKSHDAGFDTHMVKPVDLAALEKLLANLKAETA